MILHQFLRLLLLTLPLVAYLCDGSFDSQSSSSSSFRGSRSQERRQRRRLSLKRRRRTSPRIVGGKDVTSPSQYPFFANWYEQGCGATLIAPDLFLSAAHCYIDGPFGRMVLGSIDYEGGKSYDIQEVWYHPSFDGDFYEAPQYDFLIARVNESIPTNVATPVTLNTDRNIPSYTNEELMVIGYGSLDEDGNDYPSILQEVTVPYLQTEPMCQQLWKGAITPVEMCTVDPTGTKDSCYGDSGGPILTLPDLHQVGVVSWGDGCGRPDAPAVAARVSAVAESWIQPQICLHSRADPLPSFCQNMTVDLPLSLRLDLISNMNGPTWQSQNISFGLYQVTPPEVIFLVKNGVTVINNPALILATTERTAANRKKEKEKDKDNDKDKDDDNEEATHTFQFDNLREGLYYFRISQELEDIQKVGTFQHVRLIQGGGNNDNNNNNNFHKEFVGVNGNRANLPTVVEHSWMELDGSTFEGFSNQYINLHSSWTISDVELPDKGTTSVVAAADGPFIELTIDAFYDLAPAETSWELRDLTNDEIVIMVERGNITQPGFATYSVKVPASTSELQFRIWDSADDGICCGQKGDGWIEIWAGLGRVWAFDGIFDDEFEFQFQL